MRVHDRQALAYLLRDAQRLKSIRGGRGSGKTFTAATAVAMRAAAAPGTRIMATRQFQASIAVSAKAEIERAIGDCGLVGFKAGRQEITHSNGSVIRFHGLERQLTSIKGWADIGLCWVEEAQFVPEAAWIELLPTIRAAGSQVWATYNPRFSQDWIYHRTVLAPEEGEAHLVRNYQNNPAWPNPPGLHDPEELGIEPLHELEADRARDHRLDPELHAWIWRGELFPTSGLMFAAEDFRSAPDSALDWITFDRCRAWDLSWGGQDFTAGVLVHDVEQPDTLDRDVLVVDVVRRHTGPEALTDLIVGTALADGEDVSVCLPEDPAAGAFALLAVSDALRERLPWTPRINVERPVRSKEERAFAHSRLVSTGHVWLLQRPWTRPFIQEHAAFGTDAADHDDQVDALGDACRTLGLSSSAIPYTW